MAKQRKDSQLGFEIKCKYDALVSTKDLIKMRFNKNCNDHPSAQIKELAEIMKYQGVRSPIVISKEHKVIAKGHGRLLAALENDWKEFPVEYQSYKDADQLYADVVADNAIAKWSKLRLESINVEIPNLGPDFDIKFLGIKDFVLDPSEKLKAKKILECPQCKCQIPL